jgi:hypothetical protein
MSFNPYEEKKEIGRFHDSFNYLKSPTELKKIYGVKPLTKQVLKSSSMSGGSQKKQSPWILLIKEVMSQKNLTMKESIKYIKENNLY